MMTCKLVLIVIEGILQNVMCLKGSYILDNNNENYDNCAFTTTSTSIKFIKMECSFVTEVGQRNTLSPQQDLNP